MIKNKARVLLVDDSPADTKILEVAARKARWIAEVHTVGDGTEALEFLRNPPESVRLPNLILLDLNMPKMNGFEFLKIVKDDPKLQHIPTVVLTTSSAPKDILESYRLHASCFITKPPDFPDFLKSLKMIEEFWTQIATLPPDFA